MTAPPILEYHMSTNARTAAVREGDMRDETILVRGGLIRSNFDETAEALFLTSGYVYSSAEEAEASFEGETEH